MKKFLLVMGILLLIIVVGVYTVAFTGFGNNLLKPTIEKIASQKSGQDIKLSKFDLNFGSLDVIADVNSEIKAHISGDYSLFAQSFDLTYKVDITDLKSFKIDLEEPMGLAGQIRGKTKDFSVNGVGNMLDSNVRFLADIKDFKPYNVNLDAKGLNTTKALALAKQRPYITGEIDALANIKNGVGEANITSSNLVVSKDAAKDFNITIPNDIPLKVKSDITYQNDTVKATSAINSDLLNLSTKESIYNLESKTLTTDFSVNIADLGKLEPFTKQKLSGSLDVNGATKVVENKPKFLDFTLSGLGGEIIASLKDSTLNADIKDIKLEGILGLIGQPKALNGVINGTAVVENLDDTSDIKGGAKLIISEGSVSPKELKKLANIDFPAGTKFSINSDTNIENGVVKSLSSLNSNLLNVPNVDATYDIAGKNLDAKFSAVIIDLSKLKEFTKKTLNGNLKASGDAKMSAGKFSSLNVSIDTLGGNIKASSNGSNLDATVSSLDVGDMFALIGQEALASGKAQAKINLTTIDPKNLNGTVDLSINSGVFNDKALSKMIKKDFPKGVKFDMSANAKISNSVANFSSLVNTDLANIKKFDGSYNINNGTLNADYIADIDNLRKFKFIAGRNLNGTMSLNGSIKKDPANLVATANSDLFSGKLAATINNENVIATFDKFQISELTYMLDYGKFYEGVGDLKFNYNTIKQAGDFNVDINQGHLTRSKLTDAVSLVTQRDITKQIFNDSYVKGVINQGITTFDAMMKAPKMDLNVSNGTVNSKTSAVDILVNMNVEKTDISATIKGTTKDPKVNVSSKYLEQKLDKAIGKGLDKIMGVEGGSNESSSQKIDKAIDKGLNKLLGIEEKEPTKETPASGESAENDASSNNSKEEPKSDKDLIKDSAKELLKGLF
ncbi:hypothetical protein [Campylobacter corcagiensis]|uniref:Uncharacterized protein n=1 Tax=Campylobacter corcagiensis TaxID=1448857 RepID=A0A7M1LF80_9BACT|nr:hypothetical protein [Campylobacter corcagiensis]QKF65133.1 hypothetical protein CCORG_1284 [Campylobacter corcagiensis]QOQ86724.1 hypothetical protein IMC76_05740 [Campylobacter corcagiensis]